MNLSWQIEEEDIRGIKTFYEAHKDNPFVLNRVRRNIEGKLPKFTEDLFWEAMASCLLTTQQRSGPNSAVTRFICTKPFPLNYPKCKQSAGLGAMVRDSITDFGGLRRANKIGDELEHNLGWLKKGGWEIIKKIEAELTGSPSKDIERKSAEIIDDNLKGFGPKQSRNLLQSLGLTRHEIPIDSRITRWLNNRGFPVRLSATALADRNYYNFVMDGTQRLCKAAKVYPCVLDAAIFASFDDTWSEDQLIW